MQRKLVKQGRNALTVTLPAQWLQSHRLKAGETVEITEYDNSLIVSKGHISTTSECIIDASELEQTMLYHVLSGAYLRGNDRIIIRNADIGKIQDAIQRRLLGFVIEEHSARQTTIKSIIAPSSENTSTLIRRAGHLLEQHAAMLVEIAEHKATQEQLVRQEDIFDSTLFFCMRHLNTYEKTSDAYKYFLLCATFEQAGDRITKLALHIQGHVVLAEAAHKAIKEYNQAFFARDFKRAYKTLRTWRASIGTKTYVEGLMYSLADNLYNNLGYLIEQKHQNI
jgi:hypothetical protein